MTTYAHTLTEFNLARDIPIHIRPAEVLPVRPEDPAIRAMTDLKYVKIITVNPEQAITFAQDLMKNAGVRLLVVVDSVGRLAGLVTARDFMGEKPVTIMTRDRIRREEIQVGQVMTPRADLNPFNIRDIEHATVRDIILRLRAAGRQHAIVIEEQDKGYFVRGIFSITQIGRQLGMEIPVDSQVQSFAEFEKLIA